MKAILFDMVGVLIFRKEGFTPKTEDEINALNIEKLYNHVDDQKLLDDIKQNLNLNDDQINRALVQIPAKFENFSDLWIKLPELKKQYKIAVINNGNALAKKYWDEKFDFIIFDLFVNSGIEKVRKPDPTIYLLACDRLGIKPEECLFMDDTLENVKAAEKLGMKTLWWNKENTKEENLQSFLKLI
ncbi:MAG: HAD-IA family hydrolase [bacterium]|nr:HAD-IA family hydrolase [bacterium]